MAYSVANDIYNNFGTLNVQKWADLDNNQNSVTIAARIAAAIAWADNEINVFLKNGIYTVPFTGTIPKDIIDTSAVLAGVWLYESRGVQDFDPNTGRSIHRLSYQRDRAYKTIRQILSGQRKLNATTVVDVYPKGTS